MPPRKQKPANAKPKAAKAVAAADDDLDALLDAAIRENEAVPGSLAAQRLEQEQREAREKAEQEQREAREKATAEAKAAKYTCGSCGAGRAKLKCSVCASVRYCGDECEAAHWPEHKLRCLEMKAEAAAAAEAKYESSDNPDTERGNCWTCGADNPHHLCNRCKVTKYCGVACQTENWSIHKDRCAELKAFASSIDGWRDDLKKVRVGTRRSQEQLNVDLRNASALGRIVDIERIIAAGGNVNFSSMRGWRPLHWAAQEGHARAIRVLLRHGADVDARMLLGATACYLASQNGQLKAVAALLEHRAQIDTRDNQGWGPLFWASERNYPEIVALLLEHGAQVDLLNKDGRTPVMMAAREGHVAVARLLLEHGAQIDARDNMGLSSLAMASEKNHPEVVALLLQKGAQVDLPENEGYTPLGVSVIQGHAACVRLLLQAGADPLHRSVEGFTPLDIATYNNHPEVVALLQARIAELASARS